MARIGSGGMAEVWRADAVFEDGDRHPVAIKRVLPELASQELYRSMFEDEARLGMLLRHPNIVRVHDAREAAETLIMVMELVDGTSLRSLLAKAHRRRASMPVATALFIGRELAKALDYAHLAKDPQGRPLGIIHRDVSPHNLLLSRAGGVKLTDFGLADASVQQTQLDESLLGGKLGYLAPEILRDQAVTHRIDLFALGIVIWEMLCGQRLFSRDSDAETVRAVRECNVPPANRINPRIPPEVQRFLDDILAPDPTVRVDSANTAVHRLDALIREMDPDVGPRDVALLVGLHLARESLESPTAPPALSEAIAHELDAFARQGRGQHPAIGAVPLDPNAFSTS
ncbi:MAG: serine/threonine-protein kinase [Sandaracinaceae bacterium]